VRDVDVDVEAYDPETPVEEDEFKRPVY